MKDPGSAIAASGVLEESDWSQLVSLEVASDEPRVAKEPLAIHGGIVGTVVGFLEDVLLVTYPGHVGSDAVPCRTIVDVTPSVVGRQALLIFDDGDAQRPILIGVLRETLQLRSSQPPTVEVEADQKRVTLTAKEQIVLQCGAASITLTKAGKLIMRGEYISQRSTGVVRIKGGCVEIN